MSRRRRRRGYDASRPAEAADPGAVETVDSRDPHPGDSHPEPADDRYAAPRHEPAADRADAGAAAPPREETLAALPAPAPRRPRTQPFRGAFSLVVFAVAAFGTGLIVFNNLVMPRLIHSVGEVRVPELTNLTLEQAEQLVTPLGLQLSRAGERFDPSVPSGFILTQDPAEGTPVRGKKRVMVVVSLGEEFSSVPEVFGESLRGARLLIERAGLKVGGITRTPSDEFGDDLVLGTDPPAESVLPRETPVSLLVSTGLGVETFVMPDLMGREIGSVRRQLEALGFRVLVPPAGASVGPIVYQEPAAGSRITRDAQVVLQATGRMIR